MGGVALLAGRGAGGAGDLPCSARGAAVCLSGKPSLADRRSGGRRRTPPTGTGPRAEQGRVLRAMAGGPPKALLSTGPQSLRDMPHPLAGSSSEEAVGGDSTPSPDLLMARSFGDKVGCLGLGTPGAEGGRVMDRGPPLTPGRAHFKAPFPGIRRALAPRSLDQSVSSCCPRGVAAAARVARGHVFPCLTETGPERG